MSTTTISEAYSEGLNAGHRLVEYVGWREDREAEDLRAQIAALIRFRLQHAPDVWHAWQGRKFAFDTKGLGCALSIVLVAFPSLLRFVKVRSYTSTEQTCRVVWGMWLSPQRPNQPLLPTALLAIRNTDFVRGFVDGVTGSQVDAMAEPGQAT